MTTLRTLISKLTFSADVYKAKIENDFDAIFFHDVEVSSAINREKLAKVIAPNLYCLEPDKIFQAIKESILQEHKFSDYSCLYPYQKEGLVYTHLSKVLKNKTEAEANSYREELVNLSKEAFKNDEEKLKNIQLAYEKLCIAQELKTSLTTESGEKKISAYKNILDQNTIILSQHRDPFSDRIGIPLFLVIMTLPIAIIVLVVVLIYEIKRNQSNYGHYRIFNPESKNMMDGAKKAIDEYEHPVKEPFGILHRGVKGLA